MADDAIVTLAGPEPLALPRRDGGLDPADCLPAAVEALGLRRAPRRNAAPSRRRTLGRRWIVRLDRPALRRWAARCPRVRYVAPSTAAMAASWRAAPDRHPSGHERAAGTGVRRRGRGRVRPRDRGRGRGLRRATGTSSALIVEVRQASSAPEGYQEISLVGAFAAAAETARAMVNMKLRQSARACPTEAVQAKPSVAAVAGGAPSRTSRSGIAHGDSLGGRGRATQVRTVYGYCSRRPVPEPALVASSRSLVPAGIRQGHRDCQLHGLHGRAAAGLRVLLHLARAGPPRPRFALRRGRARAADAGVGSGRWERDAGRWRAARGKRLEPRRVGPAARRYRRLWTGAIASSCCEANAGRVGRQRDAGRWCGIPGERAAA